MLVGLPHLNFDPCVARRLSHAFSLLCHSSCASHACYVSLSCAPRRVNSVCCVCLVWCFGHVLECWNEETRVILYKRCNRLPVPRAKSRRLTLFPAPESHAFGTHAHTAFSVKIETSHQPRSTGQEGQSLGPQLRESVGACPATQTPKGLRDTSSSVGISGGLTAGFGARLLHDRLLYVVFSVSSDPG